MEEMKNATNMKPPKNTKNNNTKTNKTNNNNNNSKKKPKQHISAQTKALLWNSFNEEIINTNRTEFNHSQLECTYNKNTGCSSSNSSSHDFCEQCQAILAFSEDGFMTCTNPLCRIVYKDMVDQSAEWRFYGAEDNNSADPTRCGMPTNPLLEQSSMGCKVLCLGPVSYEMRKIRRYTESQSMPYKEKSQYDEFQFISIMSHNAGIPKIIIDGAMEFHKIISENSRFRTLNREGILAASLYVACRVNNVPRSAKEIAVIFKLDNASASKGCKMALHILNSLETNMENNEQTHYGETTPQCFMERFCCKLNINAELTKLSLFVAHKITKDNLMPENNPQSIASSIIYFISQICKLNITKTQIKQISGTSEVTINQCYKKLNLLKAKLIPNMILEKYAD